jgi:hypothetical protein
MSALVLSSCFTAVTTGSGCSDRTARAQWACVKAANSAALEAFREAGITRVGTVPERRRVKRTAHGKVLVGDVVVVGDGVEDEPRDEHGRWMVAVSQIEA